MSRRQVNPSRRFTDGGVVPLAASLQSKSRSSPHLSVGLIIMGVLLLIGYSYKGGFGSSRVAFSRVEGDFSCTLEVQRAIPILKKTYGDSMRKILHVGPDSCSVVSELLNEEDTEAWGVEPYDVEDADHHCKGLVRKGIVRVADIKFPLPYREKSFSLVIVSDALDYLSPKYLNRTLPDLARISADGLVIFTGYPVKQRTKAADISKFGRPAKLRSSTLSPERQKFSSEIEELEPMESFSSAGTSSKLSGRQKFSSEIEELEPIERFGLAGTSSKSPWRQTFSSEIEELEPTFGGSPLHQLMGYSSPDQVMRR